ISKGIQEAKHQVLIQVAEALQSLGGDPTLPLDCAALRGGIPKETRWARTPLQPVLLCSTVDQIGSRLLHRGYGISPNSWPIQAGLLGNDTLIILDEAHCSKPFQQTLSAIERFQKKARHQLPQPWAFVPMTATPNDDRKTFELSEEERRETIIARRLEASKPALLLEAGKKGDQGMANTALEQLRDEDAALCAPGNTVLVVLNRVRAARILYDALDALAKRAQAGGKGAKAFDCIPLLLTGRSRPLEREHMLEQYRDRIMAGRTRSDNADAPPLIVVATQCVEVGADLDADVLISEACPMDSLRQRFGRLDRLGERGSSPARIIIRPELIGDAATQQAADDPVYGEALSKTWWWLQEQADNGTIDCGVAALDVLNPPMAELAAPSTDAPLMFPAYCNLWVQTGPAPAVSPDPAIFLHGPQAGPAAVNVVWRGDLVDRPATIWGEIISACPPLSQEALTLPLHLARAWLAEQHKIEDFGADIEGHDPQPAELNDADPRQALAWRGSDRSELVRAEQIRPGDTLVVPTSWGGADAAGWTGSNTGPVSDLCEAARVKAQRPAILRLCADTGPFPESVVGQFKQLSELSENEDPPEPSELKEKIKLCLEALHATCVNLAESDLASQGLAATVKVLHKEQPERWTYHPGGRGLILYSRKRLSDAIADFSDEDEDSSLVQKGEVGLDQHLEDVRAWADYIAGLVQLPQDLRDCVALAGHLHDLGKADRRFQAWLKGGNRFKVNPDQPIAKSAHIAQGAAARQARLRSGYPQGARHELLSVRLIEQFAEQAPECLPSDPLLRDLVLHLVASHHGRCRPWAPAAPDSKPETVTVTFAGRTLSHSSDTGLGRVDSGVAERFWRLVDHFGWWGLSYLEACLR
ncbi:MAG: type I-U CRISPR-associated helicase/endonuclease Cas3, partial [Planctomycetota bacterium]